MVAEISIVPPTGFAPDDIIREVKHLPSAPKVLPRLKKLLSDVNSGMPEIVTLIRLDPGIAARVLQMANSAYFNTHAVRCLTVDEAVQRVGYDQVYQLVSYAVASQVLVRPLEVYGLESDALWRTSVACAISAEVLANRTGQDPNIAYTIGLLHRVGMVAIDEWALRHASGLKLKSTGWVREATEAERAALGFTQAEVGATLLRHWNFPLAMSEPLRWQYTPLASGGQARMASLLLAAKWLRSAVCGDAGSHPALPDESQLQPLRLSPTSLYEMSFEVEQQMAAVSSLLSVEPEDQIGRMHFPAANFDRV